MKLKKQKTEKKELKKIKPLSLEDLKKVKGGTDGQTNWEAEQAWLKLHQDWK